MPAVPWDEPPLSQTRFVEDPADAGLVALLGVLRRRRAAHELPPFEPPDWLPFFDSINVPHCRQLPGPPQLTTHLVVGRARSSTRPSVAAVFIASDDILSLSFGPAHVDEIARGGLVTGALGRLTLQLVPDGVTAADLEFADGDSVRAPVSDNLWWHSREDASEPFAIRLSWIDADGHVSASFED